MFICGPQKAVVSANTQAFFNERKFRTKYGRENCPSNGNIVKKSVESVKYEKSKT